jgi:hypothetical protein
MFVPDDAKKRRAADELTPAAWYVYEAHCEARSHKTGLSRVTKERIAEREHLALKTVRNATTELKRKNWIAEEVGGVRLLVGDFSPVDKRHSQPSLFRPQAVPERHPEPGNAPPENGKEIPCIGKEIPCIGNGPYKGSRARDYQPSDQQNQPVTHTHMSTQPARAREGDDGVCVSIGKSKFSKPELRVHAEACGLGEGWVTVAFRSGEWDAEVGRTLARRELALEGRAPVEQPLTPYHVAAQMVASIAKLPGCDVDAYIERYPNVGEETRARLRAEFVQAPAGEVERRAHAPP